MRDFYDDHAILDEVTCTGWRPDYRPEEDNLKAADDTFEYDGEYTSESGKQIIVFVGVEYTKLISKNENDFIIVNRFDFATIQLAVDTLF